MSISELAGKPAPRRILVDAGRLVKAYRELKPDPSNSAELVSFGTSGHRGTSLEKSFNEDHVLAICQAICELRKKRGISGPLYAGKDTHALSGPALETAVEVFAANRVELMLQPGAGCTPTPVISHAILTYNRGRKTGRADGVVITPSHNPPESGGFKYNPPEGGPADTETTAVIQGRANEILKNGLKEVRRLPHRRALKAGSTHLYDYIMPYVDDLKNIIDLDVIAASGIRIGVDPLGGSGLDYWDPIAAAYRLEIEVVNRKLDPAFSFMTVDHDGKIRMDCSSPHAMAKLIGLRDKFDIAFGNDPDYDRHGIVTPGAGLLNPNHYLSVAISYLFTHRPRWGESTQVGKTLVSSSMIDRVTAALGRKLSEVPVGFKWFVEGLLGGRYGFAGEESAGASFLRKGGAVWTTDKDGFIMDLLAAEITAATGKDPGRHYRDLEKKFGRALYERTDAPATPEQKKALSNISPEAVRAKELAGEKILAKLTRAPGNNAPIGGLKVVAANGWFAARPSGTEDIYKIYAESFKGKEHLRRIQQEARRIVSAAFRA